MNVLEKWTNREMERVDMPAKKLFMGKESKKKWGKNGNWTFVRVYKQAPLEMVGAVFTEFKKNLSEFERKVSSCF